MVSEYGNPDSLDYLVKDACSWIADSSAMDGILVQFSQPPVNSLTIRNHPYVHSCVHSA